MNVFVFLLKKSVLNIHCLRLFQLAVIRKE